MSFTLLHAQSLIKRVVLDNGYFKLERLADAQFDALLNYDITYNYTFAEKAGRMSFQFNVNAKFYPEKSYFHLGGIEKNIQLLKHEQGHADIVVLNARKLLQLLNTTVFTLTDYREKIEAINKEVWILTMKEQDMYDTETSHGVDRANQERWNQKFDTAFKQ